MKKILIIANWKSNKDLSQAEDWLNKFKNYDLRFTNKEVIICPSLINLPILKSYILNHNSGFRLGAQNISPFGEGAYTGEISAKQIKEFANYVIVGHSERRKNFSETNEIVKAKIDQALKAGLIPIVCISDLEQVESLKGGENLIIAYEPLFAIGSGESDTPENANEMAKKIKEILGDARVLYGGSVTSMNAKEFLAKPEIEGLLVGKASLDASEFYEIIKNS